MGVVVIVVVLCPLTRHSQRDIENPNKLTKFFTGSCKKREVLVFSTGFVTAFSPLMYVLSYFGLAWLRGTRS